MKRRLSLAVSLLLALWWTRPSFAQNCYDVKPPVCPDVSMPDVPECHIANPQWNQVVGCLNTLVTRYPNLFPGAVIGRQVDGKGMQVAARGAGFATDSVATLGSVSKPLVYIGLLKVIQDHHASAACSPTPTARCLFPNAEETPLKTVLERLDAQKGTDVYSRWYNNIVTDDAAEQRSWKDELTVRHIAQMTGGFPEINFTAYRFCNGGVCPPLQFGDVTCDLADADPDKRKTCHYAYLYNQYLERRGGAVTQPAECRPRPDAGPRLFPFCDYYGGVVDHPDRLARSFERRYSYEPGLLGECVLLDDASGKRWKNGRTVTESEVAKFFLGMPLLSRPGTEYHYSQPNLYVASFLIEAVTGMRFDVYLKTAILDPLKMFDTSFVLRAAQEPRLLDIKRVPPSPARVLPDLAPPVVPTTIYGADKNWDEPREGWTNRWPEGGAYSTAEDLLRFLAFIRTGRAPNGDPILVGRYLTLATTVRGPVGTRTLAFNSPNDPSVLEGNSYFAPYLQRNKNTCENIVVLMQTVIESPETRQERVQLCDYQYEDIMDLRGQLIDMMTAMAGQCPP